MATCRLFFFFQAEDGIRDHCVTGVQTCALPIWQLTAGLALLVTAGLLFLHIRNRTPGWLSPDHYITPVLSIIAATAFSILAPDYRIHTLAMLKIGRASCRERV